jgi:hypothetical protein
MRGEWGRSVRWACLRTQEGSPRQPHLTYPTHLTHLTYPTDLAYDRHL